MGVPMKTVMVTEANQRFSKLIQEVERDGVTIRILRRDRPIACSCLKGKTLNQTKNVRLR